MIYNILLPCPAFDSKWDMKRHYSANHAPPKKEIICNKMIQTCKQ